MEKLRFLQRQIVQKRRERHWRNFARRGAFAIQLCGSLSTSAVNWRRAYSISHSSSAPRILS
jgi:hypothetical protein